MAGEGLLSKSLGVLADSVGVRPHPGRMSNQSTRNQVFAFKPC